VTRVSRYKGRASLKLIESKFSHPAREFAVDIALTARPYEREPAT